MAKNGNFTLAYLSGTANLAELSKIFTFGALFHEYLDSSLCDLYKMTLPLTEKLPSLDFNQSSLAAKDLIMHSGPATSDSLSKALRIMNRDKVICPIFTFYHCVP